MGLDGERCGVASAGWGGERWVAPLDRPFGVEHGRRVDFRADWGGKMRKTVFLHETWLKITCRIPKNEYLLGGSKTIAVEPPAFLQDNRVS